VPDDKWGETGRAFVVLAPDTHVTSEAMREELKQRLATYKVPRDIVLVDELPRNATGKIQKHALRANA
jgi:acyl-CoA synthetase (AMP-forming)/AMP-acid ligase II